MHCRHLAAWTVALSLAALAALAPLAAAPARADVRRVYEAGVWNLFTGTADSGRAVCDMRVTDDANAKKIDVIYFDNDDHLTMRMNKTSWQIPGKTRIDLVLQFDAFPIWTATADGAGGDVEFTVPTTALPSFSRQFRYGSRMRISFPSGSEAPWIASLAGTNFMLDRFLECVQRIRGTPTQPYAAPAPQPYAAPAPQPFQPPPPPRPTQPYAGGGQPREDGGTPSFGGGRPEPYRGSGSQPQPTPAAPAPRPPQAPAAPPTGQAPETTGGNDNRI